MGKDLGDLIVRLSLNSTNFDDGLKRLETGMGKVQNQFKSSSTGLTDFGKVTEKLQSSADTLTKRLESQKEKVSQLEKAYEESKRTKGEDAEETQKLAAKLEEAKNKLNQTQQALDAVNGQIKLNQNGWYQLGVNLEGVGDKLQKVGKSLSDVGGKMSATITAPVAGLGTACVKTFMSFDDGMRQVQATMNASDTDMQKLTATAKEMGATTRYTARDAADGLNFLALAGYDADKACEALPKVLNLAAAGAMDLGYASDLVTDSMSALGIEMKDLETFTDQMAVTAQKSNTNIAQLSEGILTVGGTAKILKGGTQELNTALGILADNGIKGAEGGTKLRNMILSLTSPTDKSAKLMKELGLQVFDAEGKMKPLNDVFKDLDGIMATMTQEQRQNVLSEIFNKADLKGAEAMLANCGDRWDELNGYIGDSIGATQQMAETMEGGIGGSMRSLSSAVEGLAIAFGERLAPFIKAAAEKITEITRKMTEMNPQTMDLIIKIAAIAAAIGPLLLIVGKLTSGVGSFFKTLAPLMKAIGGAKTGVTGLGTAFQVLTGPVGIIAAAIAGLALLFVHLYQTNEEFREKVQAIWAQICQAFENVKEVFAKTFDRMKESMEPVKEALSRLWETVSEVFQKIWTLVEPIVTALATAIGGLVAIVISAANGILNAVGPLLEALINGIDFVMNIISALVSLIQGDMTGAYEAWNAATQALGEFFMNIFEGIKAFFQGFWEALCSIAEAFGINLGEFMSGLWESIKTTTVTVWEGIKTWIGNLWQGICDGASTIWETLKTFFSGLWEGIQTAASEAWAAFTEWIKGLWQGICEGASAIWAALTSFFSGLWEGIKTTASTAWDAFVEWLNGLWQGFCDGASAIWEGLVTYLSTTWENIKTTASEAWEKIKTAIENIWNNVKTAATTAWNAVCTNIQNAVNTGKTWITTAWNNVKTAVEGVWNTVKSNATTAWNVITTNVKSAVDGAKSKIETAWTNISTGISNGWNTFKTTATNSWNTITSNVKSAVDGAKSKITTAWENIKTGVKTTWDKVLDVIKSPINSASTWISDKVEWFKGLFNFTWKLPEFKLPKINVRWEEIGWGIKLPKLSVSWNALGGIFDKATIFNTAKGLQGVGEAGPEAVLPLDTLWTEMSARVKAAMREILTDAHYSQAQREEALITALTEALKPKDGGDKPQGFNVTQHIYANQTSYVGQQREAARNFRQIARALT